MGAEALQHSDTRTTQQEVKRDLPSRPVFAVPTSTQGGSRDHDVRGGNGGAAHRVQRAVPGRVDEAQVAPSEGGHRPATTRETRYSALAYRAISLGRQL